MFFHIFWVGGWEGGAYPLQKLSRVVFPLQRLLSLNNAGNGLARDGYNIKETIKFMTQTDSLFLLNQRPGFGRLFALNLLLDLEDCLLALNFDLIC